MATITAITARQILDSRGNPTVEADVYLDDGSMGRASVPSGASTGSGEAHELRDGGDLYDGMGVLQAAAHIEGEIATAIIGQEASDQTFIDRTLCELDGTERKERLGANALLAVSLATAKAEAASREQFLFEYVQTLTRSEHDPRLPMPLANLMNGGKHAAGSTDIQEFLIIPVGAERFSDALRMVVEVFHALRGVLNEYGYPTTVGDEGGFAPPLRNGNREALELLVRAVERAGYRSGDDISFGIDVAATELLTEDGRYRLVREDRILETEQLIDLYGTLAHEFPLVSIEDGLSETDWSGWQSLTDRLKNVAQIIGDDLFVTDASLLQRGIETKAATGLIIKVNQVGTLTEALDAFNLALDVGWETIVSHRSGETEDTTIAHLAVGLGTGQIKTGSVSRTDRVAKYNELLRIEESLGDRAEFARWE